MIVETPPKSPARIVFEYPLAYHLEQLRGLYTHDQIADMLMQEGDRYRFYMCVVTCDRLADEHWDDPAYLRKENNICVCEAREDARRDLVNKYMSDEELKAFIKKQEYPTWKYNYKEQPENERGFVRLLEDSIFEYQQLVGMVGVVRQVLSMAKYALDADGYPIEVENENEEDEYKTITDPEVIERQENMLLERYLKPRVYTSCERVYDMPAPFNYWDSRSFWHQFFFVEDLKSEVTFYARGQGGSSGCREVNGRWVHTFGTLAKKYGVAVPTFRLNYDEHNQLWLKDSYPGFRCCHYDMIGNYQASYSEAEDLLKDYFVDLERRISFL